ncbi:type II toxin-antitoxin system ParD family antitoxin [Glutamicibacter sp. MNS18]|uniref:type II toxin-antitoxin system ParD family antitoxin n=1 Tax=Glutamicibacter sp. MNS18 TaxID=2989817 RepID=UPI002235E6A2|nr:type II toxin-antitoxin system ParD family antitoxin [Glutamicibacter sp. MNS18]MCW4466804.1 type II toxin-antitoxin system ParD family antitoxin [Glutamicibacter sp. MNS18]
MPTRYVVPTDHQHDLITLLVDSGRYQNASEVLREGLRLVEQRDQEQALKIEALRRAIDAGLKDFDKGRLTEVPDGQISDFVKALGNEAHGTATNL